MTDYKRKRLELGLTQEQVSEMTGISKVALNYIEKGTRSPHLEAWYALCTVLDGVNDGSKYYVWDPEALRRERIRCSMTQQQLAEKMHMPRQRISGWENEYNGRIPTVENISRICYILGNDIRDFLKEKDRMDCDIAV